ncbi:17423_t:CDS:1, partial [Cetraspora pellucida]
QKPIFSPSGLKSFAILVFSSTMLSDTLERLDLLTLRDCLPLFSKGFDVDIRSHE